MTEPITKLIAKRLNPAYDHAAEFAQTYNQFTPLLSKNITALRELVRVMDKSAKTGRALLDELEVIHGYAQEGQEIAVEHADDMAQLATLMINLDVFLQGDPKMLLHVLQVADPAILKEAAGRLDSDQLILVQQAINAAVNEYKEASGSKRM